MQAKFYAEEFNRDGAPRKVDYLEAFALELDSQPGVLHFAESFVEGEYVKHNTNSGYVGAWIEGKSDDEQGDIRDTPQAFSHYTFSKSKGEHIIVDVREFRLRLASSASSSPRSFHFQRGSRRSFHRPAVSFHGEEGLWHRGSRPARLCALSKIPSLQRCLQKDGIAFHDRQGLGSQAAPRPQA